MLTRTCPPGLVLAGPDMSKSWLLVQFGTFRVQNKVFDEISRWFCMAFAGEAQKTYRRQISDDRGCLTDEVTTKRYEPCTSLAWDQHELYRSLAWAVHEPHVCPAWATFELFFLFLFFVRALHMYCMSFAWVFLFFYKSFGGKAVAVSIPCKPLINKLGSVSGFRAWVSGFGARVQVGVSVCFRTWAWVRQHLALSIQCVCVYKFDQFAMLCTC